MIAGNQNSRDRHPQDYYPTPSEATLILLANQELSANIWEPACGQLHISKVLEEKGHRVKSTDINEGEDFFEQDTVFTGDIVTNPPFKYAQKFVEHALTLTSGRVCMLMALGFMTSQSRKPLMTSGKLEKIIIITKRLKIETHYGEITSQFNHAWFIFNSIGLHKTEVVFN